MSLKEFFMFRIRSLFAMRLMFFTYLVFVVFLVTSCQNNQDDNNNTMTTNCVYNPSQCSSNIYQQGGGFSPYSYQYSNTSGYSGAFYYLNNSAYLCNCPAGSIPTYNSYGGLGCVQSSYMGSYGYAYMTINGSSAGNNQWMNIPQISNVQGYSSNGCYNGVVQSCIVSNPSTCSAGYVCRPTDAASAVGLCASTSGNSQMGQIYR
jgi:hypothetical protein